MRYSKLPQQQIINTYTPPNVDFYANILNRAQENLNQAEIMKAKYMEELYNLPTQDPTSMGQYIGGAQDIIQNALNKPFVSPADTAKAIMKASQYLAPIKALNTLQLQAAQREQQARLAYGAGYIGNSPSKVSLINPATGKLVSPQELELIAANSEDFNKSWIQAYGKDADRITVIPGTTFTPAPGTNGQSLNRTDLKIKGLTEDEVATTYLNNQDKINQLMQNNPQLVSALKASGQNPVEWFTNNHNNLSRGLIGGTVEDITTVKNYDHITPQEAFQMEMSRARVSGSSGGSGNGGSTDGLPITNPTDKGPILTPYQDMSPNAIISRAIGPNNIDFSKVNFDSNGNVNSKLPGTPLPGQTLPHLGNMKLPDVNNPDYMTQKLQFEKYRLSLMRQATSVQEVKKLRTMSHKDLYNVAVNASDASSNSAKKYKVRGLTIADNISFNGINPLIDVDDKYLSTGGSGVGLEIFNEKTNQWEPKSYNDLLPYFSYKDGTTSKNNLPDKLKDMSSKELDFTGNPAEGVKIKSTLYTTQGNPINIRYSPGNSYIKRAYEPYQQVQQSLITPGTHTINIGGTIYTVNTNMNVLSPSPELKTTIKDVVFTQTNPEDLQKAKYTANAVTTSDNPGIVLLGIANNQANNYLINNNVPYVGNSLHKGNIGE